MSDEYKEFGIDIKQEALLGNLLEYSTQPFAVKYPDGRLGVINGAFEKLTGYTKEELKCDDWYEMLTPPEFRAMEQEKLLELERTGKPVRYEKQYIRKDGTCVPIELMVHLSSSEDGTSKFYYAFINDITERKQAERELKESEEKFKHLVQFAPTGIYEIDYNGPKFKSVNDAMCEISGYSKEEFLQMSPFDLLSDESKLVFQERIQKGLKGEKIDESVDFKVITKDGREIWAELKIKPTYKNGRLDGALAVAHDITERKKADEALRESNMQLKSIFDNSKDIIYRVDLKTRRYLFFSSAVEEILGCTSQEIMDHPDTDILQFIHPDDLEKVKEALTSRTSDPVEIEYRMKNKTGHYRWLLSNSKIIRDCEGQPIYRDGVVRDITERKRWEFRVQEMLENEHQLARKLQLSNEQLMNAQNELKETIKKLEISNRELEQFAYVASHDLQEPLRMVASFTQLLDMRYKNQLDEDADDYIGFIVEGATRMKDLIDDLLAFSRLNTEAHEFELMNMGKCVNEVLSYLKASIDESNAEITRDPLPFQMGDYSQIIQLFQNLISNAIKFQAQEPPRIHISAQESGNEWTFSVNDNGIGIDPEHQEKIFDVFRRLHTREEYEGTGIGLSICKRIVERHGGRIWVESAEGNGSTFYFTIPKT